MQLSNFSFSASVTKLYKRILKHVFKPDFDSEKRLSQASRLTSVTINFSNE